MTDGQVRTEIILEADKQSALAAQRVIDGLAGAVTDLGKTNLDPVDKATDELAGRFKAAKKQAEELGEEIEDLIEKEKKFNQPQRDSRGRFLPRSERLPASETGGDTGSTSSIPDAPSAPRQPRGPSQAEIQRRLEQQRRDTLRATRANDEFTDVSEGVGQFGDAESSIRAIAGAIGTIPGAAGIEQAGNALGEFFAVLEAGPRLLVAFKNLPDNFKAAQAALGLVATTAVAATAAENAQAGANTAVATTGGAAAVSMGGLLAALGPVAIVGAAVTAAFVLIKGAMDAHANAAEENAKKVTRAYEATDSVFDAILGGDTSEDARKQIETEQLKLEQAQNEYSKAFQQANQRYIEIQQKFGTAAAEIAKNRGTDEFDKFAERQKEQQEIARQAQANIDEYTRALEDNAFAANDAKIAEEKRKEEQEKAEREAKQKEEQRLRDIESTQKRIDDVTTNFNEKAEDDARGYTQKLADIELSLQDKRLDIQRKYRDDLAKLSQDQARDEADARTKISRDAYDARIKAQQSELDANLKHQRSLDDIRRNAERSEEDQLKQRNFLGAALATEAAQRQLDDANLNAKREAQDRAIERDREAAERALDIQRETEDRRTAQVRARQDLNTSLAQQQRDAITAYDRQQRDALTQYERLRETAQINYTREQEELQKQMDALLGIRVAEIEKEKAIAAGAPAESVLRSAGNTNNYGGNTSTVNDYRAMTFNGSASASNLEAFRRIALETMRAVRY